MTKVPAAMWLAAAVALGVLPSLIGWLFSYGVSLSALAFASYGSLCLGGISLFVWGTLARRSNVAWLGIGEVAIAWVLALVGSDFVGTWVSLTLWNPDQSPPFMTVDYATQQGIVGVAIWSAAVLLLVFAFRWGGAKV